MNLLRQLAGESVVYGLASASGALVALVMVPIYTRILSSGEIGIVALLTLMVGLLQSTSMLALDNAAMRWYWEGDEASDRRKTIASWAWCYFFVALLLALVTILAAEITTKSPSNEAEWSIALRFGVASVPCAVPFFVAVKWLRMQRRPWATFLLTLASATVSVALAVFLVAVLRRGVRGVFEAQLLSSLLGSVIAVALLKDWLHPRHYDLTRLRSMLAFSLPLIPAGVAVWVVSAADRFFLQYFLDTSEVGIYQVGLTLAAGVGLFTIAFQQAWGPFAYSIYREPGSGEIYSHAFLLYSGIAGSVAAAVSLFAPELLRVFATPEYLDGRKVVGILAFGHVMMGMTYIAVTGAGIARKTLHMGLVLGSAAILNIVLNATLTPAFGKEGAATATMLSHSMAALLLFRDSQRVYPIPYDFFRGAGLLSLAGGVAMLGSLLPAGPVLSTIALKFAMLTAVILVGVGVSRRTSVWYRNNNGNVA